MHLKTLFAAAILAVLAIPAAAQEWMERQQCIWGCLYGPGNGDAGNPAYHQCVDRNCGDGSGGGGVDPTRQWQAGRGAGGSYAGIDAPGAPGDAGLYMMCANGRARVDLVGIRAGSGPLRVVVDGRAYATAMRAGPNGWLSAPATPALIGALGAGNAAQVTTAGGRTVWRLSLRGSRQALATAMSGC